VSVVSAGAQSTSIFDCKGVSDPCTVTIESESPATVRFEELADHKVTTIERIAEGKVTIVDSVSDGKTTVIENLSNVRVSIADKLKDTSFDIAENADAELKFKITVRAKGARITLVNGAQDGRIIVDSARYGNAGDLSRGRYKYSCDASGYIRRRCEYVEWKLCKNKTDDGNADTQPNGSCDATNAVEVGVDFKERRRSFCVVRVSLLEFCGGWDPSPGAVRGVVVGYRCVPDEGRRTAMALDGQDLYLDCIKEEDQVKK
jgi:hypothetical protein